MKETSGFNGIGLKRTKLHVRSLQCKDDSKAYWHSRTPQERLLALEYLRYHAYGYDPFTDGIPRVLEIVQRRRC